MGSSSGKVKKPVNLRNSVKSFYIIETIFSILSEKKKLNMIIYNKKYQNNFEVNIEYYKAMSVRYIVGEKNGKGKEYNINNNKLIFEGEYKNGKRKGKGKEYYENGKVKFEGEYLNGNKISGKGYDNNGKTYLIIEKKEKVEEYYSNGELKFKGNYFNGKIWNGIGYNDKKEKEFEIKEGNGKGKEYIFH